MTWESLATGGSDPTESFSQPVPRLPDAGSSASIDVEAVSASSANERRPAPSRSHHGRSSARSDAASDFRSVIDDLTLENRKLKEELCRFQQTDSPSLHMDQILEVKCHGLSAAGKRDLESVLRNFATSSKGSSRGRAPRGKQHGSGTMSSACSSSTGLRSRGTTQALPWGGLGRSSPAASPLAEPTRQPAQDKAESTLHQNLGCMRSHLAGLSDNEKKEVVVRRLEQLFTGKQWGYAQPAPPPLERASTSEDARMACAEGAPAPTSREAHIDPNVKTHDLSEVALSSPVAEPAPEPSENTSDSVQSRDTAPRSPGRPEQRATRPQELDPRRAHTSAQNMDYIRHLGIGMPDATPFSALDVSQDSEGWVHLNLLGSMAQLSMLHVTPAFIRNAVAEKSEKLQLSNDGQQVHWRGGTEGTQFGPSDSGANHDGVSPHDGNETGARKRQRMWEANDEAMEHEGSSAEKDFHYKPMFVHQYRETSSPEPLWETGPSPLDEAESGYGWPRERKASDAMFRSDTVGSPRAATPRKRSREGAIYFYAGAPFYTDLSGDRHVGGSSSPTSPSPSLGCRDQAGSPPPYQHVPTGLSDPSSGLWLRDDDDDDGAAAAAVDVSGWDAEDEDSGADEDDDKDEDEEGGAAGPPTLTTLETSGLAGVVPLDHFVVSMSTRQRRVPACAAGLKTAPSLAVEEVADEVEEVGPWNCSRVARRVAAAQKQKRQQQRRAPFYVEYVGGGELRRLPPVPPPPPVHILSSDSSGSSDESGSDTGDDGQERDASEECFSWGTTERPPRLVY